MLKDSAGAREHGEAGGLGPGIQLALAKCQVTMVHRQEASRRTERVFMSSPQRWLGGSWSHTELEYRETGLRTAPVSAPAPRAVLTASGTTLWQEEARDLAAPESVKVLGSCQSTLLVPREARKWHATSQMQRELKAERARRDQALGTPVRWPKSLALPAVA